MNRTSLPLVTLIFLRTTEPVILRESGRVGGLETQDRRTFKTKLIFYWFVLARIFDRGQHIDRRRS